MLKNILIIVLFFISWILISYADSWTESLEDLSQKVDILEYKLPLQFEEKLNSQGDDIFNKVVTVTAQWLSQQQILIGQQQTWLVYFSIIFALVSIWLGWYITWISNKIKLAEERIKNSEESAKKIETELEWVLSWKTEVFYTRIQEAETRDIFKRLEKYPEEIDNVFSKLATRNISSIYFKFLKDTVLNSKTPEDCMINYAIILFQHFYREMLNDDSLYSILQSKFSILVYSCFPAEKNDMFISISLKYLENESNEKYLWFLKNIKPSIAVEVLAKVKNQFIEWNKEYLWDKITQEDISEWAN